MKKIKWVLVDVVKGKRNAVKLIKKIEREGFFGKVTKKGKGFFSVWKSVLPREFYF